MIAKWRGELEDILGYEQYDWRKRIVAMASFVNDEDKSVMDLGAGKMHLKRLLNDGVKYYPVDYKKNAADTVVCDFNKYEFPDIFVDVIVAAGILEYIEDPFWFMDKMTARCSKIIISYKGKEKFSHSELYTNEIIKYLNSKNFIMTGRDETLADKWTLIAAFEKVTPQTLSSNILCTGCGACNNICPVDAIKMDYDKSGYLKPYCDISKCISCNRCVETCPQIRISENSNKKTPEVYAAWASDEIRNNSSSGGAFSVIAQNILSQGGVVFGEAWEKDFLCRHMMIDSAEELCKLRHSKYVQSDTKHTFRKVKQVIASGKKVLFVGCPCQIAGLKNFLGKLYDNELLLTVDLICFCAPSNKLFRKYLSENFDISNIADITFRDKNNGWSSNGYRIDLKNGEVLYPNYMDSYQQAFHNVLARNYVCENCEYTDFPRQGDITLGDFWGIDRFAPLWDDKKGTSMILVNSLKGDRFFKELLLLEGFKRIENVPYKWIRNCGNRIVTDGQSAGKNNARFCRLVEKYDFNTAVNYTLNRKYDIGLCVVCNRNIGNNLTNYALYNVLSDMDKEVLLIDAPYKIGIAEDICDLFYKRWIDNSDIYLEQYKIDYYSLNSMCDIFVTGSDQIWRSTFVENTNFYTCLDWVNDANYKIAYGTSMGIAEYEGDEVNKRKFGFLINRFNSIGIREKSGAEYLNSEFGTSAISVMDPVFLCDVKKYKSLAALGKIRLSENKYTASYMLDTDENISNTLKYVSSKLTENNYHLILDTECHFDGKCGYGLDAFAEPSVEDWLGMIYNSDFFVTDSFHGVCFSLIFHKQFLVVFNKANWRGYDRIIDLLAELGLSDRIIASFDAKNIDCIIDKEINFEKVQDILDAKISSSRSWLSKQIDKAYCNKGQMSEFDYLKSILYEDFYKEFSRKTYDYNSAFNSEIRKITNRIYTSNFKRHKRFIRSEKWERNDMEIIGWGAGDCFCRNIEHINSIYKLKYVCDNNPEKWGKTFDGVKCISPKTLSAMSDIAVIIMVDNPGVTIEIADELLELGIDKFDHVSNWFKTIGGDL